MYRAHMRDVPRCPSPSLSLSIVWLKGWFSSFEAFHRSNTCLGTQSAQACPPWSERQGLQGQQGRQGRHWHCHPQLALPPPLALPCHRPKLWSPRGPRPWPAPMLDYMDCLDCNSWILIGNRVLGLQTLVAVPFRLLLILKRRAWCQ